MTLTEELQAAIEAATPPMVDLLRRALERIESRRPVVPDGDKDGPNYQRMFHQTILTLAKIDESLGIPDNGCAGPERTIIEIEELRKDARRYRWIRLQKALAVHRFMMRSKSVTDLDQMIDSAACKGENHERD